MLRGAGGWPILSREDANLRSSERKAEARRTVGDPCIALPVESGRTLEEPEDDEATQVP
jgi:hypothetical protein